MTHQIAVTSKGHQVYRTVNGRYRLNVGPAWPTPREAIRYANQLDVAYASGEGLTPVPLSPLRGRGSEALSRVVRTARRHTAGE